MKSIMQIKVKGAKMRTTTFLLLGVLLFTLFTGCSGDSKKEQDTKKSKSAADMQTSQKIEIVKNKNAKEIKVAQKESDTAQSKSYYYDYNLEKKQEGEAKPRNALDANLHIRSPYEKVEISMLVKKLSKEFIVKCSACHNDYANGVIGPSLLGKSADYIFEKIAKFKDGSAKNVLMRDLVSQMSEEEIRTLADEIYNFNKKIAEMRK